MKCSKIRTNVAINLKILRKGKIRKNKSKNKKSKKNKELKRKNTFGPKALRKVQKLKIK